MTGSMWTCLPGMHVHVTLGGERGGEEEGFGRIHVGQRVTDATDMQYKGPLDFVTFGTMFDYCM